LVGTTIGVTPEVSAEDSHAIDSGHRQLLRAVARRVIGAGALIVEQGEPAPGVACHHTGVPHRSFFCLGGFDVEDL